MAYVILRFGKLKTAGNIGGLNAHLQRTRDTPNADPELTHQNEIMRGSADLLADVNARLDEVKAQLKEVGGKVRENAVLAIDHLITFSPDFVQFFKDEQLPGADVSAYLVPKSEVDADRLDGFKEKVLAWLDKTYGAENVVNVQLHLDESTPHIHAVVVPVDERGKLNCRAFLGGREKLRGMQSSIAAEMAPLGLVRGVEGSKAKHQDVQRFYALAEQLTPGLAHETVQAKLQASEKDRQKDLNPPLTALIHYHDERIGANILEDLRALDSVRIQKIDPVERTIKVEYSTESREIDKIHALFGAVKIGNNHIEESGADFRQRGSRAMELELSRGQGLSMGE
jgi:hypothetical protein